MDSIDITDLNFSLDNNPVNKLLSDTLDTDYTSYIYIIIGVFILISLFIGVYIYKNKANKATHQDKLDECYGGVCYR